MNYNLPPAKTGRKSRVFSYQRFSSGNQSDGSSLERQNAKFQHFFRTEAEPLGYVFDTSFVDKGVSAFRGKHRKKGKLAEFLRECEKGVKVKEGDILAVEDQDRFCREGLLNQIELLLEIIKKYKLTLVFLNAKHLPPLTIDTINNNPYLMIMIEMGMTRTHEESVRKQDLVEQGIASVQKEVLTGSRLYSSNVPRWLDVERESRIHKGIERMIPVGVKVNKQKAKVVKQIFQWRATGKTIAEITTALAEQGIKSFSGNSTWSRATLDKLFKTRHVLGYAKFKNFDQLQKIYPAVIDEDLWYAVQNLKRKKVGTGYSQGVRKRSIAKARVKISLFDGLLFCGYGQGAISRNVQREHKGKRYFYLRPKSANDNTSKKGRVGNLWNYDAFEKQFINYATNLDWKAISEKSDYGDTLHAASQIERLEAQYDEANSKRENLQEAIEEGVKIPNRKARMDELNALCDELAEQLESERSQLSISDNLGAFSLKNNKWIHLIKSLEDDDDLRAAAAREIKEKIRSIELFANGWVWNKKTFDMAVRFCPPEFLAMYRDVEGHSPQFKDSGFKQQKPKKNYNDMAFFLVHWRNGYSQFHMPHFEKVKGIARPFGYNFEPSNSMNAGVISMDGCDKRQPFEFNPRALGFEIERKFETGIEERWCDLPKSRRINYDNLIKLQRSVKAQSLKKVRAYKSPSNRFGAFQEMINSGIELTQKESREYYKLRQKYAK